MNLIEFLESINRLKKIKRKGWVHKGIQNPESVAEHIFRSVVIAMILGGRRKNIDSEKLMKMVLIHDIPEAEVGDITPKDGISKKEKHEMERKALEKILSHIKADQREEYMKLWEEFEKGKTKEARLAREIDKMEMTLQALEYELEGNYKEGLGEFFDEIREETENHEILEIFRKIETLRKKRKK